MEFSESSIGGNKFATINLFHTFPTSEVTAVHLHFGAPVGANSGGPVSVPRASAPVT